MANETTTKFRVDISELKAGIRDANRQIALANSQFKEASAGMQKWANDTDGLNAKIKQLKTVTSQYEKILDELEKQYTKVVDEQGENSKGAIELQIKINSLKAAIKQNTTAISQYETRLNSLESGSREVASATDKLKSTIREQENELDRLKKAYQDVALEQGKNSTEAKDLAKQIYKLSNELNDSRDSLNKAENASNEFDNTLEDMKETSGKVSEGFTIMKGALADLVADGIRAGIDALKEFVIESEGAYSKFQAATGATNDEMEEFKDTMDDLYTSGMGENLQDIGDKMAYVKQVTGEIDPSKLGELTENAMTLEDTFGSDYVETIRGVNNLMTHFGLSSEEAFDLFAKGSQLGLDYTGELGDNIAEYGGNFKQAGYSAEQYFQLLVNGSKNGAYNLDKVNDSINEVKNRIADGTIEDSIEIFSDGTEKAFKAWKKGKGTMKDVIDSIVKDINKCEDEQDALNMAAVAFGTMGEDANLKVIKSLTSVGNSFEDVEGTMEDIKKIRYDDVGSRFKTLGRTLAHEVLTPMAEKALPYLEKFGEYGVENVDKVIDVLKQLAITLGTVFVVNKLATFIQSITTMVKTFNLLKTSLEAAEKAQKLLNLAQSAMPIAALALGLAGIVAVTKKLNDENKKAIEKEYGLTEAQNETVESAKKLKESYDQVNEARKDAMQDISAEYGYLDELKKEYNGLIDSNGNVKKGYEDRANFILTTLAEALGMEVEEIQKIIDKNGELGDSIDTIIQKKQAEALLSANEAAYTEAIKKKNDALKTYQESVKTLDEAEKKYAETQKAANNILETYNELLESNPEQAAQYYLSNEKILSANDEAKKSYEKAKSAVEDSEEAYVGYITTIQNYEGLSSAIISGDAEKIKEAMKLIENSFITAETGTKASLENQVKNMKSMYENLKKAVEEGTPGVTQAQVDAAWEMVVKSEEELAKLTPKAKKKGEESGQAHADGVKSKNEENKKAGKENGKNVTDGQKEGNSSAKTKGKQAGQDHADGVKSKNEENKDAGKENGKKTTEGQKEGASGSKDQGKKTGQDHADGVKSKDGENQSAGRSNGENATSGQKSGASGSKAAGQKQGQDHADGVKSKDGANKTAGKSNATNAKSGAESVDATSSGTNFSQGFINGIGSLLSAAWNAAYNLARNAWAGLKKGQDEGSPSKLTAQSGNYFVLGYANMIAKRTKVAVQAAKEMAKQTAAELDNVNVPSLNSNVAVSARNLNARKSSGGTGGQTGGIVQNFYQNNYSPKALSRLEIYRQTKNQLRTAKGVS